MAASIRVTAFRKAGICRATDIRRGPSFWEAPSSTAIHRADAANVMATGVSSVSLRTGSRIVSKIRHR